MSTEWGIFSDEGCIEAGMWSEKEAQAEVAKYYIDGERNLLVSAICPDHEERAADTCEECNDEECQHDNTRECDDDTECLDCGEVLA